jgi:hypothetical protein
VRHSSRKPGEIGYIVMKIFFGTYNGAGGLTYILPFDVQWTNKKNEGISRLYIISTFDS